MKLRSGSVLPLRKIKMKTSVFYQCENDFLRIEIEK